MTSRTQPRSAKTIARDPQHDAHVEALGDQQIKSYEERNPWKDWPPAPPEAKIIMNQALEAGEVTFPGTAEDKYVIACSDSIENLYWSQAMGWRVLSECTLFTRDDLKEYGEAPVVDGFWMPLERAQELEE